MSLVRFFCLLLVTVRALVKQFMETGPCSILHAIFWACRSCPSIPNSSVMSWCRCCCSATSLVRETCRARQSHWYCQMALIPFLLSLTGELKHRRKMYILAIWGDTLGLNTWRFIQTVWFFFLADKCEYKEIGLQAVKKGSNITATFHYNLNSVFIYLSCSD